MLVIWPFMGDVALLYKDLFGKEVRFDSPIGLCLDSQGPALDSGRGGAL